jgi:hypothetical protein
MASVGVEMVGDIAVCGQSAANLFDGRYGASGCRTSAESARAGDGAARGGSVVLRGAGVLFRVNHHRRPANSSPRGSPACGQSSRPRPSSPPHGLCLAAGLRLRWPASRRRGHTVRQVEAKIGAATFLSGV